MSSSVCAGLYRVFDSQIFPSAVSDEITVLFPYNLRNKEEIRQSFPVKRFPHRSMKPTSRLPKVLAFGTLIVLCSFTQYSVRGDTIPESVQFFLDLNCYECHNDTDKKGGVDIENLQFNPNDSGSMRTWTLMHDRVRDLEMPPKKNLWPEETERTDFITTFESTLHKVSEEQQQELGRVRSRRLNRVEYENTLHDLLGIDIPLQTFLPEDQEQDGFNNIADAQQISYHLLQTYLEAADASLEAAFQKALNPRTFESRLYQPSEIAQGRNRRGNTRDPFLVDQQSISYPTSLSYHGRMPPTKAKKSGWYRIRFTARSVNAPKDHGVWTSVRSGYCYAVKPLMYWIGSFEARDEPETFEFEAWIEEDHMIEIRPNDRTLPRIPGKSITGGTAPDLKVPGVALDFLEVTPIYRRSSPQQLRELLFEDLDIKKGQLVSQNPEHDIERLVSRFAERAFRRPVPQEDLQPYIDFALNAYEDEQSVNEGLHAGFRAILSSPRFLYFQEKPGELDPHSIASRLSYFLWNRPPDETLLNFAASGNLRKPQVLQAQVERMLQDSRSQAFIENFAAQWLDLKDIDFTTPDEKLYPEFDEILKNAMLGETHSFLRTLLDENLSVTHIIDSDFAMLNERIARHYGIEGVSGTDFRRVALKPEHKRGGIITHGSILKVTANGTTSSPVIRGVWMLERILGEHISPPPDDVPAIEPDIRGATSIREQLDKHRSTESCNACHAKIDPPGFALENYDVIGGWRQYYRALKDRGGIGKGPIVDPSYDLKDGRSFQDLEGFKRMILAKPDQIARNLVEKTLVYATGARIEFADRREIESIVEKVSHQNYGFRSILHAAVQSSIFLEK